MNFLDSIIKLSQFISATTLTEPLNMEMDKDNLEQTSIIRKFDKLYIC